MVVRGSYCVVRITTAIWLTAAMAVAIARGRRATFLCTARGVLTDTRGAATVSKGDGLLRPKNFPACGEPPAPGLVALLPPPQPKSPICYIPP